MLRRTDLVLQPLDNVSGRPQQHRERSLHRSGHPGQVELVLCLVGEQYHAQQVLRNVLPVGFQISGEPQADFEQGFHVQRLPQLGHYAQLFVLAGVAPGLGYARRADRAFAFSKVLLPSSHPAPEGPRENLMPLLMVLLLVRRVDVLGDGETGRKNVLEPQQLAVRVLAGFEEDHLLPGDRVPDHVSSAGHGASPCRRSSSRARYRCSHHLRCGGRSHKETWAGCTVSRNTDVTSRFNASRSVSFRSFAEKAASVFSASYFLR